MAQSPIVARWELSRRLRSRRKELSIDVKTIAEELDFTRNYWSAVEHDRTVLAEGKLRKLLDLLEFDEQDRNEMLQLRADSRKREWWDQASSLDDDGKRFVGFEDGAVRIRTYDSLLMPGLLQTDDYARAVVDSDPVHSPIDIEDVLDIRRQRRGRLNAAEPVKISALISQAAVMQQVGGPEIQLDQLTHLVDIIENRDDSVEVRVIPFTANPGVLASSSTLVFLEFARRHLPTVAYQESVRTFGFLEYGEDQFRRLDLAWRLGLQRSLDREQSLDLIRQAMAQLTR